jgi:zinc protease
MVPKRKVCWVLLAIIATLTFISCISPRNDDSRAILLPVLDDPTVAFTVWFQVGSQNDPPGKDGLAALTGALISNGATATNGYQEILEKLYPLASEYSVHVDKEMTTLNGHSHIENLEKYFALLTDAYLRPDFNQDDFNRLKSDQLNYLEKTLRYASDEELGKEVLSTIIFTGTPYRHPVQGTVAGLKSITLDDVKVFYKKFYIRENARVALGGGYPSWLVKRFEKTLESLPSGQVTGTPVAEPPQIEGRSVVLVQKDNSDASISLGFPISVRRGERAFYALWIANSWLGEHRNSSGRLYNVIRGKRGMNYGNYSYIEAFPQGGSRFMPPVNVARRQQIFQIWIRTLPNSQAQFALRAAVRQLVELIEKGMNASEFELTRSFLSKYYLHFAETTQMRLGYAVDDVFYGISGKGHLARFSEMMASMSLDEVNAALKKYLQHENMIIVIITGEAESLAEALRKDLPSPMKYGSSKAVDVLEEDKLIESYSLEFGAVRIFPVEETFGY